MKTLVILSSILGDHSTSRKLVDHLVNRVAGTDTDLSVQTRDLGAQPLPYFDGQVLGALSTPAEQRSEAQRGIVAHRAHLCIGCAVDDFLLRLNHPSVFGKSS